MYWLLILTIAFLFGRAAITVTLIIKRCAKVVTQLKQGPRQERGPSGSGRFVRPREGSQERNADGPK
jgi:hypothetical protein